MENTLKGNSLALASAAKAVIRTTAEQKVKEFLERAHRVNEDDYFSDRWNFKTFTGKYNQETNPILPKTISLSKVNWVGVISHLRSSR